MLKKFSTWLIIRFAKWLAKDVESKRPYLSDFSKVAQYSKLGDILLIEGTSRVSRVIKQITQSSWTHSALYIGRLQDITDPEIRNKIHQHYPMLNNEQLVIESIMGKGTIISKLNKYQYDHIRICRPEGLTREDTQKIIAFTVNRLGGTYNLRHIFDLARFLFPWGLYPRRWRSTLFNHNALKPTEDICSSLIAQAFQLVKFPIVPKFACDEKGCVLIGGNPKLITPSDFDYSPFFKIIKYPIFSEEIKYKNFPWKDNIQKLN